MHPRQRSKPPPIKKRCPEQDTKLLPVVRPVLDIQGVWSDTLLLLLPGPLWVLSTGEKMNRIRAHCVKEKLLKSLHKKCKYD